MRFDKDKVYEIHLESGKVFTLKNVSLDSPYIKGEPYYGGKEDGTCYIKPSRIEAIKEIII